VNELRDVLDQVLLIADEDDATRLSFAALGMCRTVPRGNILFHHGDPALALYVIVDGGVKIVIAGDDGRELALDVLGPGDVCGLVAVLDGGPHTGTAITLVGSRIAMIPQERFRAWLAERPALQGRMLLQMAQLLRVAWARVGSQTLLSVKDRVRATLLDMARANGTRSALQELVLPRPTHQEIAERVGSTRVVVSRALKTLLEEEEGISMEGRVLRVRLTAVEIADDPTPHRA
jgi:CRP/FNR family transcriptional regulator, cyclic AMP receptor protein